MSEQPKEFTDKPGKITNRLPALVPYIMVKSHHQKSFDSTSVQAEIPIVPAPAKALKKMLRNDDNNTRQSGDTVDLESNEKTTSKTSKIICIVVSFLAMAIITTLIVFFCYSPRVLDDNDRCLNQDGPFQTHKLFSTKTLYTTAFNYINRPPTQASTLDETSQHQHNIHPTRNWPIDKTSVTVPKIFSVDVSLESIHKQMTSENKCKLRQFHYFGRHAARTPDAKDIVKINQHIKDIKSRIDLSKIKTSSSLPEIRESSDVVKTETSNITTCHDPLLELGKWDNFFDPKHGNMVTEFGFQESEAIALRFKSVFPELFDGEKTRINFGTTQDLRTAQTAISFLKHMKNYSGPPCRADQYPVPNTRDKAKATEIIHDDCFKQFLQHYQKEMLRFHKTCKEASTEEVTVADFHLNQTVFTEFISKSVSEELQFNNQNMLTPDETRAIYDVCRYETAQLGETSIWCRLFKDAHLNFYAYLSDISDFFGEAYGHPDQTLPTCKVTSHLMQEFWEHRDDSKLRADFHFTHSSVIQKMIAASIDLGGDGAFKKATVRDNLHRHIAPQDRQWQSSLMSPFSANIAFTLYDCGESKPPAPTSGNGEPVVFMVSPLKVMVSLNEKPIILKGCTDYVCDANILSVSRLFKGRGECDFTKICGTKYVVM